jgi:hypothetical protein
LHGLLQKAGCAGFLHPLKNNSKQEYNYKPMDNELQCKICGKPIKGGCYNAPDGPFCVDCWDKKISEKVKKDYEKQALKRLQAIGLGFKTNQ